MLSFNVVQIDNGFLIQRYDDQSGQQTNVYTKNAKALVREIRNLTGLPAQGKPKKAEVFNALDDPERF